MGEHPGKTDTVGPPGVREHRSQDMRRPMGITPDFTDAGEILKINLEAYESHWQSWAVMCVTESGFLGWGCCLEGEVRKAGGGVRRLSGQTRGAGDDPGDRSGDLRR